MSPDAGPEHNTSRSAQIGSKKKHARHNSPFTIVPVHQTGFEIVFCIPIVFCAFAYLFGGKV